LPGSLTSGKWIAKVTVNGLIDALSPIDQFLDRLLIPSHPIATDVR
jgi:hypothetical protein